jgi:hypothetical protein
MDISEVRISRRKTPGFLVVDRAATPEAMSSFACEFVSVLALRFESLDTQLSELLDFTRLCFCCLARLLLIGDQEDLDLLTEDGESYLNRCLRSGVRVMQMAIADDTLKIEKKTAKIAQTLFPYLALFDITPSDFWVELISASIEHMSGTETPFAKHAFLQLLRSIMDLSPELNEGVARAFTETARLSAAALTKEELDEFVRRPVQYLNNCLLLCNCSYLSSPRARLMEICERMSPADRDNIITEFCSTMPAEGSDYEAVFYLLHCLTSAAETPMDDAYIALAVERLSPDITNTEAATLVLCLARVHQDPEQPSNELLINVALFGMQSDSPVVKHVGIPLFGQNVDLLTVPPDLAVSIVEVLCGLAREF